VLHPLIKYQQMLAPLVVVALLGCELVAEAVGVWTVAQTGVNFGRPGVQVEAVVEAQAMPAEQVELGVQALVQIQQRIIVYP
jgi:hypothetical protein